MPTLSDAISFAVWAHDKQQDRTGELYILHPLRVMLKMKTETERIVAVLHDVVEDTGTSLEGLRYRGYSEEVIDAVDHLTRRDGESYAAFIFRVSDCDLARRVKIADLDDNMDLSRLSSVSAADTERNGRYARAKEILLADVCGATMRVDTP